MKGYNGKILRVNLTNGQTSKEEPPESYYRRYLGGRGFIIHTLLTEIPKGADPLGPANKLIFALGPITGHPFVGSGRNSIGAKSPLSGGFGESEAGGFWGSELKKAGYDAIIVEGISSKPVYLWVHDGEVEIRDAGLMWGMSVADAEQSVKEDLGDRKVRTATIGPGGEKLVRFACIANDISHVAGRTGMGAVMGSKRLKAIAVRGTKRPAMADESKIKQMSRWMGQNFKEKTNYWRYGTAAAGPLVNFEANGTLPVRNFRGGRFPGIEKITGEAMRAKSYVEKMEGCFACPIKCKTRGRVDLIGELSSLYGLPEYETLAALGSNCGVDDLEALIRANELCGSHGIDSISAGVCISFAMECFEKGILTLEDTEGLTLTFGSAPAMVEMVERIALRKGLGDLLAEGTKRAAAKIGKGAEAFAMQVKGEEIPMHEPRYKQGMGLHYSVHATGADHCSGVHDEYVNTATWESIDVAEPLPSTDLSPQKARMVYQVGLWRQTVSYLGVCLFVPWSYKQIVEATEAITGWPMSYWRLMKAVERGVTLGRIFNLREGFSAKDDRLPKRFFTSAPEGPLKDVGIDPEELAKAQKIYYQMFGWDESGVPTYARLVELDIEWASRYLD